MSTDTLPPSTSLFKRATKTVFIKLAISTTLLCLVFYFVPFNDIWNEATTADKNWLILAIFLQILLRCTTALRMQIIARAQNLYMSVWTMMKIVFSSTFYSMFAPGALAGGIFTYIKYLQHGAKPDSAIANLYANKVIETFVIALVAPLFWLIDKDYSVTWIFSCASTMVVGIVLVWAVFLGRYGCMQWLATLTAFANHSVILKKFTAAFTQIHRIGQVTNKVLFSIVGYSLLNFSIAALSILCFAKSLGIDIEILPILWIYPIIYLLHILPISISNIGIREVSMIVLFAPYGISTTEAATWSLLMYSGLLLCGLIGIIIEADSMWRHKIFNRSNGIKPG